MKEKELRSKSTCAVCGHKILVCGVPMFYTLELRRHALNMPAINRKAGLEMMLNSPALASIMGPDEDMTSEVIPPVTITVCEACNCSNISIGFILAEGTTPEDILEHEKKIDLQRSTRGGQDVDI